MGDGKKVNGGQILVECLLTHGVKQIFGVPGESYLAALDSLYDCNDIQFNICRQEGGAAMMAEAYGKLTDQPGICMVSRGPGATNASAGVHIASQDSTPMILFIGQVGRFQEEREAYQEVDFRQMFGQICKWVAQINNVRRIPEFISRAFFTATSGRPGPVVLSLPEDMLEEELYDGQNRVSSPYRTPYTGPSREALSELQVALAKAKKPVMLIGGGGWNYQARADVQQFAEKWDMPVAVSLRCQDYFNNDHPCYIGELGVGVNPALFQRVKESDTLLVVGPRLGDMTTSGYTMLRVPNPEQHLIHVHSSAEELGRVYVPNLAINSSVRLMAANLELLVPPAEICWNKWRQDARSDYEKWNAPQQVPGELQMADMIHWFSTQLDPQDIVCTGAGNYANWVYRFHRYRGYFSQLAPTSGTMGYSIPAAVTAKLINPNKRVIAFAGDGCFMMHGQELATAAQYGLNIVVIIINNNIYGTIRMHQELAYPDRVIGTRLKNPDFCKLIEAYGGKGYLVEKTAQFKEAVTDAFRQQCLTLIEVRLDEELIAPLKTIGEIKGKTRMKKD